MTLTTPTTNSKKIAALFTLSVSLFLLNVSVQADTFLDTFSNTRYDNQDGDVNWSSDWTEQGDNGSPFWGDIEITGGRLHIQDDNNAISRSVDLSPYTSATLSFDYELDGFNSNNDSIDIQIRTSPSNTWVSLASYDNANSGNNSDSFDISGYLSSTTELRFITANAGSMNNNDDFDVDNFQIVATTAPGGGSGCSAFFPDGASSNNNGGFIEFGWQSSISGSPDNILDTTNLIHNAFDNNCDAVDCSSSGTTVGSITYSNFPGGSNVNIGFNQTLALAPGDYRRISMSTQTTLILSPGDYTIEQDFNLGYNSTVIVNGTGTARIFVDGTMTAGSGQVQFNTGGETSQIFLYTNGDINFPSPTFFNGIVYSQGNFSAGSGTQITGAVTAASITLESSSFITYDSANVTDTDFGSFCVPDTPPEALAEYRFEEPSWNSTFNEVVDETGSYNAQAQNGATTAVTSPPPAINTDPGTCRYGVFDGVDDYVALPSSFPNLTDSFTITAWINPARLDGDQRIFADDQNNNNGFALSLGDPGNGRLRLFSRSVTPVSADTSNAVIANTDTWYFISAVHNATQQTRLLYVNGVNQTMIDSAYTGTWGIDNGPATIGGEADGGGEANGVYRFSGRIDEVQIYSGALSASEINQIYSATHACPAISTVDHFDIDHSTNAIYCSGTTVQVTAEDISNATITTYTGTITLDTGSTQGDWSLLSGNGLLDNGTSNDGVATYTFNSSDNGVAQFTLNHSDDNATTPLSLNLSVTDASATDDDLEGLLTFYPSGFTLTANALSNPVPNPINDDIATQVAGTPFNVHVAAYGTTPTDPSCGIIESYNGNKNLVWAVNYTDPATGTISPTITPTPVTFTSGQSEAISVQYKDTGLINLAVSEGSLLGTTNNFIVRPAAFGFSISDGIASNVNPAAADATGDAFTTSGDSILVEVSARDSEGSLTPNFGLESAPETIALTHSLVAPAAGRSGNFTGNVNLISGGVFSGNYTWDDVGILQLTAAVSDGDFLGSGEDSATLSDNVGRFYPATFTISNGLITDANTPGVDFTYLGEPFSVSYDLEARSALGNITENYVSDFAKLTDTNVLDSITDIVSGSLGMAYGAIDTVSGTSYNTRLSQSLTNLNWVLGVSNNLLSLTLERQSVLEGPVSNIDIGLQVRDSDGVQINSLNLDTTNPVGDESGLINSLPGELRFGRLLIPPVYTPEIPTSVAEPIPLEVQYFDGTRFIRNVDDSHSLYGAAGTVFCVSGTVDCLLTPINLPTTTTNVINGIYDPDNPIAITRPGLNNTGNVNLSVTVEDWLQYDWSGTGLYNQNPSTEITFGRYRGHDRIIYWREIQ